MTDVKILPSYKSDHGLEVLYWQINEFEKGKGLLWKFNTSLLKDRKYIEEVKSCITKVKEQYMIPVYNFENFKDNKNDDSLHFTISDQLFLDVLMMEIRGKTISYSAFKQKQKTERENKLITEIANLENSPNPNFDLIETKKKRGTGRYKKRKN